MQSRTGRSSATLTLTLALALGFSAVLAALWLLGSPSSTHAAPTTELRVCPAGPPTCDYATVQAAVDAAEPGDTIKVAQGVYTSVDVRGGITQVLYISKSVRVEGGYTASNWAAPDPTSHPTRLDARTRGRVLVVSDTMGVTIRGFAITGGDASGLGGGPSGYDAGGGVFATRATSLTVTGCDVYSNNAHTPLGCCGYGGGLYIYGSDHVVVGDTAIRHNRGNRAGFGEGGGLYLAQDNHVLLRKNTIDANIATTSNGLGGGLLASDCEHLVLDGNVVRGNFASAGADARGGGIYLTWVDHAHLRDNVIQDNVASRWTWGYGGGLTIYGGDDVALDGNVIVGNATSSNPASTGFAGGGLFLQFSDARIVNTVFADNRSTAHGSAVYVSDCSPRFLHTTVARNAGGDGTGLYITDEYDEFGTVALTNTIVFSHTVGITVTTGNTATLHATLWHANGTNADGTGTVLTGTINVTGDPAFASDGYHLTNSSAAIDEGLDAGVETDMDAEVRPQGTGYDIGADERLPRIYLPLILRAGPPW